MTSFNDIAVSADKAIMGAFKSATQLTYISQDAGVFYTTDYILDSEPRLINNIETMVKVLYLGKNIVAKPLHDDTAEIGAITYKVIGIEDSGGNLWSLTLSQD